MSNVPQTEWGHARNVSYLSVSVYFAGIPQQFPVLLHISSPYTVAMTKCFDCTKRNEKRTLDESECVILLSVAFIIIIFIFIFRRDLTPVVL